MLNLDHFSTCCKNWSFFLVKVLLTTVKQHYPFKSNIIYKANKRQGIAFLVMLFYKILYVQCGLFDKVH